MVSLYSLWKADDCARRSGGGKDHFYFTPCGTSHKRRSTWEGVYDITVEELLSGESRGQKTKDAKSFLAEILAEGQLSCNEITEAAKERGIKKKTLWNAKKEMNIDNGANSFSTKLIEKCREIAMQLAAEPFICPTACGSIQFEYEKENGDYLEFEIYEDRIEAFLDTMSGGEQEFNLSGISATDKMNISQSKK